MYKLLLLKSSYQYNFSLYQIGYEECPPHHSFGPVMRDFYVLHYIIDGKGTLEVDNHQYELNKGDLFVVPKNTLCRYFANPDNPYIYYWIGFSSINDAETLKAIGLEDKKYIIHASNKYDEIVQTLREIDKIDSETSLKDNFLAASILLKLFSILTRPDEKYTIANDGKNVITNLTRYIDANYQSNITMDTLEKISNMHRSNIYRLFEKEFDLSPTKYIQNVRMEKALYLLKNTDYSIKKISIMCGFTDSVYFCKAFKKKHQKTPTEARNLK